MPAASHNGASAIASLVARLADFAAERYGLVDA
jgi:hypothetical protein